MRIGACGYTYMCVCDEGMRTAYWVYDSKGYMGKSTFTIFAEVLLDALILTQARKKDLLYWIVHLIDIMKCYVFDLLRLMGTHKTINDVISLAEDLKNGYVFNTKVSGKYWSMVTIGSWCILVFQAWVPIE